MSSTRRRPRPSRKAAVASRFSRSSVNPGTRGTRTVTSFGLLTARDRRLSRIEVVRDAGRLPVAPRVDDLEVEEEEVDQRLRGFEDVAVRVAARLHRRVDAEALGTARAGRAGTPAGRRARRRRRSRRRRSCGRRPGPRRPAPRPASAVMRVPATASASSGQASTQGMRRRTRQHVARSKAGPAVGRPDRAVRDTPRRSAGRRGTRRAVPQLGPKRLRLGVAAPRAAQRAALEEDERADAGPVVHRVVLDVEDDALGHGRSPPRPLTGRARCAR